MNVCPTCGRPFDADEQAGRLLALLRDGTPHRQVYRAGDHSGWYVTYGGGQFSASAVRRLVASGLIVSVYSDCPDDCYHVGKTLDVKAATEERKKHRRGKDAPRIYTDGSRELQR